MQTKTNDRSPHKYQCFNTINAPLTLNYYLKLTITQILKSMCQINKIMLSCIWIKEWRCDIFSPELLYAFPCTEAVALNTGQWAGPLDSKAQVIRPGNRWFTLLRGFMLGSNSPSFFCGIKSGVTLIVFTTMSWWSQHFKRYTCYTTR